MVLGAADDGLGWLVERRCTTRGVRTCSASEGVHRHNHCGVDGTENVL